MLRSRVAASSSLDERGHVRQQEGGRVAKSQAQVAKEDRLVAFDSEQTEALLLMGHLHKGGMGMQRISSIHPRSVRQTGQDGFGNRDLIGFRDFRALAARFPGSDG